MPQTKIGISKASVLVLKRINCQGTPYLQETYRNEYTIFSHAAIAWPSTCTHLLVFLLHEAPVGRVLSLLYFVVAHHVKLPVPNTCRLQALRLPSGPRPLFAEFGQGKLDGTPSSSSNSNLQNSARTNFFTASIPCSPIQSLSMPPSFLITRRK